jgi:two-component system, response regulator YesN
MYSLLIVDDEDEIRSSLSVYYPWSELGFMVVGQAASLAEAKTAAVDHRPDVVLSDIRMLDGTGLELASWLSATDFKPAVVLLSAYRKFEYAQEALRYGVRYYLVKPPAYDELCALFRKIASELDASRLTVPPSKDAVADTVKAFVKGNLRNATLEEAARAVGMSPSYLSTYFRERTGEHFGDFLSRSRMEKAARLLAEPRSKMEAIAAAVGYSSAKNFSRAFKNFYRVTPREYRLGGAEIGAGSAAGSAIAAPPSPGMVGDATSAAASSERR